MEKTFKKWEDVIPDEFLNDGYERFLVCLYPSPIEKNSGFSVLIEQAQLIAKSLCDIPFFVGSAEFYPGSEQISLEMNLGFVDGQLNVNLESVKKSINEGNYLLILIPEREEALTNQLLTVFRGILSSLLGYSVVYPAAHKFWLERKDSEFKVSVVSPVIERFIPIFNHRFVEDQLMTELARRFAISCDKQIHSRYKLAFELIGSDGNSIDRVRRFVTLWIGLEVAAGGAGKAQIAMKNTLGDKLEYKAKEIKDKRDKLVHHGIRPDISKADEFLIKTSVWNTIFDRYNVVFPEVDWPSIYGSYGV